VQGVVPLRVPVVRADGRGVHLGVADGSWATKTDKTTMARFLRIDWDTVGGSANGCQSHVKGLSLGWRSVRKASAYSLPAQPDARRPAAVLRSRDEPCHRRRGRCIDGGPDDARGEPVRDLALTKTWLRTFGSAPEGAPVMLAFPHAGGSARDFAPLAKKMAPAVDLRGVQYPGRLDRFHEKCAESVEALAHDVASVVAVLCREGREVSLFGHSLGAMVAFEVARRCEHHGAPVRALVVSATVSPARQAGRPVLGGLDDDSFVAEVQRSGHAGAEILDDPGMRMLILPTLRADYAMADAYRYHGGAPLECPVLAVCGDADPSVDSAEMSHWAERTTGWFDATTTQGGHFYFVEDPSWLAGRVKDFLEDCSWSAAQVAASGERAAACAPPPARGPAPRPARGEVEPGNSPSSTAPAQRPLHSRMVRRR
jgi:pyochelin biosynthesis protein PchC